MDSNKKTLVFCRYDRLVTRIRGLLNGWRISRKLDANCVYLWNKLEEKHQSINLIIDLKVLEANRKSSDLKIVEGNLNKHIIEALPLLSKNLYTYDGNLNKINAYENPTDKVKESIVDFSFLGESRQYKEAELRYLYSLLPIRKKILDEFENFKKQLKVDNYTVIHVRRGDVIRRLINSINSQDTLDRKLLGHLLDRTAPLASYINAFLSLEDTKKNNVIITSDDKDVSYQLQSALSNANVYNLCDYPVAGPPLVKDFFDFFVLTKAKAIVSTVGSNYGKFASVIGNNNFINALLNYQNEKQLVDHFKTVVLNKCQINKEQKQSLIDGYLNFLNNHPSLARAKRQTLSRSTVKEQ